MTISQWIKLMTKIITLLPIIIEGIQAVIVRYKQLNDQDGSI